jgi:hypothetical protein
MWRFMMYALLVLVLLAAVAPGPCLAAAYGEEAPAAAQPEQATASIPIEGGDPVWQPTKDQLAGWVSNGFTDAGAGTDFLAIPVIENMTWVNLEGTPLPDDRFLRFASIVTPRLGGTAYGYAKAWDEETWNNYQQDPQGVIDGIAGDLMSTFDGSELIFPLAIQGTAMDDMSAAVFYGGRWWYAAPSVWGGMSEFSADSVADQSPTSRWVGEYLLAQEATQPALQPPEQITVYTIQWLSEPLQPPDEKFIAALPTPGWTGTENVRLAVGTVDTYAWVDFNLMK